MIDLRFVAPDLRRLDEVTAEVVACGVFRDTRPLTGLAGLVDWRLAGRLSRLARQGFLVGEVGEVLVMPIRARLPFDKLLAFGLGPRASFSDETFRRALERVLDSLTGLSVKKAVVELPGRGEPVIDPERATDILLEVLGNGNDEREALSFVEDGDGQKRIEKQALDRRRNALRAQGART